MLLSPNKQFIFMAAPRRKALAVQTSVMPNTVNSGTSLLANAQPTVRPMTVAAPGVRIDESERSLVRFSQLIMLAIAIGAIWISIIGIAFDDSATNADFAVLAFGGLLSAGLAIGWIEVQSRGNDHQLRDVQDYMLGVGFFFATVGVVWGARFVIGLFEGGDLFGNSAGPGEWAPNENGIYVQTMAMLGMMAAQYALLHRFKGETKFGWAVASYAPMIVLIAAGMNIWLNWSGGVVSYGIGISMIVLSIAAMQMALKSNNSINMIVVVIASGIAPFLFEAAHDVSPEQSGGALSLLVFIIAIQGYYASKEELRSDIMQRASLVLIAEIILAMLYARSSELNLVLGPLTTETLGGLGDYFSLTVMLWVAVLVFYFPAMLQQRLPWIPIGLAFALMVIPTDESTLPWLITVAILPYLLLISKVTRRWVANSTLAMTAASFILVDFVAQVNDVSQVDTYGIIGLHLIIPIALVTVSEFALRASKIDIQVHMLVIGCVALSRAVLFAEEWYMPWVFVTYLLYLARRGFDEIGEDAELAERWKATLAALLANVVMMALVITGRLDVPDFIEFGGYRLQVFAIGLLSYVILRSGHKKEFDVGMILGWAGSAVSGAPRYDPATNTWQKSTPSSLEADEWTAKHSWSPLGRSSLIIPFIMMTAGIFIANGINSDEQIENFVTMPIGILLLSVPIGLLVWEILGLETITSRARSTAVWVLFGMGLGPAMFINALRSELGEMAGYEDKFLLPAALLLDALLVAAPLVVAWAIGKRGIDKAGISPNADAAAMMGLVALACLDSSGGLLLLPIIGLATFQSVRYRHSLPLMVAPFAFIFTQNIWLEFQGLGWKAVQVFGIEYLAERSWAFGLSRISGGLIIAQMGYVLAAQLRKDHPLGTKPLPWIGAWVWLAVGLIATFPDLDWFQWMPLVFTIGLMFNSWANGQVQYLPLLGLAQFFSLLVALSALPNSMDPLDIFSYSALISGVTAMGWSALHENGILYSNSDEKASEGGSMMLKTPSTEEERGGLNDQFELVGYLGLAGAFTVLWGIGTMIGAIMLTRKILVGGLYKMIYLAPLAHSIALYNMMVQAEIPDESHFTVLGLLLLVEGIGLTIASIKTDSVYDYPGFDWESDESFFEFVDQIGLMGVATTIIGIFMVFNNTGLDTLAFALTTLVLIGVGIQGYSPDFEARWRRVVGGYGSIVCTFITALTLDPDGIMQNIGFMLGAIVTIGWIFMSGNLLGDSNELYEEGHVQAAVEPQTQPVADGKAGAAEVIEMDELPVVEQKATPKATSKATPAATPALAIPVAAPALAIPAPVLAKPISRVQTRHGFEIELPPNMFENIITSIDLTPHDGFKPVVSFGPRGEIMLNFEAN